MIYLAPTNRKMCGFKNICWGELERVLNASQIRGDVSGIFQCVEAQIFSGTEKQSSCREAYWAVRNSQG